MSIKIKVLDAPTGVGKTTAIFNWMKSHPNKKYLYISPMLSEVEERAPKELESLGFTFPTLEYNSETETASKSYSLLKKLRRRDNVAFSHVLFTELTQDHLDEVKEGGYTLIVDEEVDFISAYVGKYKRDDTITLINNGWIWVDEEDNGRVVWSSPNIEKGSQYQHFKDMCDLGQLYCSKGDRLMLVTQLPMELLSHSKENILITYMFEYSVMYAFLEMRGVVFSDLQREYPEISLLCNEQEWKGRMRNLISIEDTPSTLKVKEKKWLSTYWYSKNANKDQIKQVANAIRSVFRKHDENLILYTMPKQAANRKMLRKDEEGESGRRNDRCALHRSIKTSGDHFLYSGARATNTLSHKTVAIHAYNRYANLSVKSYMQDYGGYVDDDKFALTEMVQWFWRTAIRNEEPVTFYFLSQRMEDIFLEWLNST